LVRAVLSIFCRFAAPLKNLAGKALTGISSWRQLRKAVYQTLDGKEMFLSSSRVLHRLSNSYTELPSVQHGKRAAETPFYDFAAQINDEITK
jgi:hypothetical protein